MDKHDKWSLILGITAVVAYCACSQYATYGLECFYPSFDLRPLLAFVAGAAIPRALQIAENALQKEVDPILVYGGTMLAIIAATHGLQLIFLSIDCLFP